MTILAFYIILATFISFDRVHSAKILGLFPHNAYSHHVQATALFAQLGKSGHEITFVSPVKEKIDGPNIKYIHIENFGGNVNNKRFFDYDSAPTLVQALEVNEMGLRFTEYILKYPKIQALIHSNESFDLVVMDIFLNEAFLGFAHRFNCNVVLVSTFVPNLWTNHIFGNSAPVSFVPCFYLPYTSEMSFLQRLNNFVITLIEYSYRKLVILPKQNKILQDNFPGAPEIEQLLHNSSLMLVNTHISINDPIPLLPNMIEVGGYHISSTDTLSEDLKYYLDSAKHGVVYFSMGSNLKSRDMSAATIKAFLEAFRALKQKVLWKFESNVIGLPENTRIEKWLPQQAILDHPNVKVFISHGGLLSTIEAVYFGVPIIGIPVFADQKMNIEIAKKRGYAVLVPIAEVSKHNILNAIEEVLQNESYKINVEKRSQIMKDRLVKPIDEAVYWVEYVLRFDGAVYFHAAALKLYWFQYYSIDVLLIIFLLLVINFVLLRYFYMYINKFIIYHVGPKQKVL